MFYNRYQKKETFRPSICVLVESGYVSKKDRIKILGRGELKKKLEVTAHAFSATAKKSIEELGGIANVI